jgi:hypothetical protein
MILELMISFVIMYLIGFFAGYMVNKDKTIEVMENGKLVIKKLSRQQATTIPTGRIEPPTAKQQWLKNQPIEKREAREAVKETLDTDPILAEHRRILEQQKQKG